MSVRSGLARHISRLMRSRHSTSFRSKDQVDETVAHVARVVEHVSVFSPDVPGSGALDPRSPEISSLLGELRKDRKAMATQRIAGQRSGSATKIRDMLEYMENGSIKV